MTEGESGTARTGDATSLADAVYDAIHHNIVTGRYRPNQRLVETDIAAELNASRTPVRTALFRLEKDGLAVKNRQGLQVREFSLGEIREIYHVRAALEGYAAALAAKSARAADLDRIAESLRRHAELATGSALDRGSVVAANAEFHAAVLEASGNTRLVALAAANNSYFFNHELAAVTSEATIRLALREHAEIFQVLRQGNAERAEQMVRDHVMTALSSIENVF